VSSLVRDIPAALDELVARCLAKQPAERFASATDLAAALADIAVTDAKPSPIAAPTPIHAMPTTMSSLAVELPRPWRGATKTVVGALALAALGVVIATAMLLRRDPPEPSSPAAPAIVVADAAIQPIDAPIDARDFTDRIEHALDAAASWSATHPNSPCPTARDVELDPELTLSCTDHDGERVVTVAGPDGAVASSTINLAPRKRPATTTPAAPSPAIRLGSDGMPLERID